MLTNTVRVNFSYMKAIHIIHLHYHPKIIGYLLKNKQKNQACPYSWDYTINHNENEDENEKKLT